MEEIKPTELTAKITARAKDFIEPHQRMDSDFRLWNLDTASYPADYSVIRGIFPPTDTTDISIVTNKPRTYADKVQARLSAAEMQIMVRMAEREGEDKRDEMGMLERLFYFALDKGDERLRRMLQPPFREQSIWYSIVRGWVAARILVYKDNKNVIFDLQPLDPRWLVYELGSGGVSWAAYSTFRSKTAIKEEYDYTATKDKDNIIWDYWHYDEPGKISNAVLCDNEFLKEPEVYDLPSMPILIMPVSTRPMIAGANGSELKGYGESIFASNRALYASLNKLVSMWATHANLLAQQPTINYYKDGGKQLKSTAYLADAVLNLPDGLNRLEPSPLKEVSPTLVNLVSVINRLVEDGSLPDIDIGKPPPSGTLYNLIQEYGNKVFNPQIVNLNNFYSDICRLIEEQLIAGKLKVKVKRSERQKYYETQITPIDLKKPHTIKVEFTHTTPWTELDVYQIADMAKRLGLPDSFIQEYILKVPDPKGMGDESAIEVYEKSPRGIMLRAIKALDKLGREDERDDTIRLMYEMSLQEGAEETPEEIPPPPPGAV